MTTTSRPRHLQNWRYLIVYFLLGVVAIVFAVRLFTLQILQGTKYSIQTSSNRTQNISIPPSRGIVYDRNGIILARNIAAYNVTITPANLPDDDGDVQRIYRELSALTGVPVRLGMV